MNTRKQFAAAAIIAIFGIAVALAACGGGGGEPTHQHEAGDTWYSDESQHWKESTLDGSRMNVGPHTAGAWKTTKEATLTEAGSRLRECTVCERVLQTEAIPQLTPPPPPPHEHTFGPYQFNETEHWQVCTSDGVTEQNRGAHVAGDWITDRLATETEMGERHQTCTICGYEMNRESIPMLEKDYVKELKTKRTIEETDFSVPKIYDLMGTYTYDIRANMLRQIRKISEQYATHATPLQSSIYNEQQYMLSYYNGSSIGGAATAATYSMDDIASAIKESFTNSAEASTFENTLKAYQLAHSSTMFDQQTENAELTTLCAQLNINVDMSDMNAVINELTGRLIAIMPGADKGIVNKYDLIQQFQDVSKLGAFVAHYQELGLL